MKLSLMKGQKLAADEYLELQETVDNELKTETFLEFEEN